jgi:hypothetical protein
MLLVLFLVLLMVLLLLLSLLLLLLLLLLPVEQVFIRPAVAVLRPGRDRKLALGGAATNHGGARVVPPCEQAL